MKAWWVNLHPGWREAVCIMAFGCPIAYLLYIAFGVAALALGAQAETIGHGPGWTGMCLLLGLFGAGVGYKLAVRLEQRLVSAEGKERSDP